MEERGRIDIQLPMTELNNILSNRLNEGSKNFKEMQIAELSIL